MNSHIGPARIMGGMVRPNPAFEKWVSRYAAIVCAASHGHTTATDWALIDPIGTRSDGTECG